jgi:kinesin family protein 3/17
MTSFSAERIKELTSINKSLSTLGNCIAALMKTPSSSSHVPFRDSKLTRLLQDSLGGNTKTLFIVTLSPSISCMDETASTLQFAGSVVV